MRAWLPRHAMCLGVFGEALLGHVDELNVLSLYLDLA